MDSLARRCLLGWTAVGCAAGVLAVALAPSGNAGDAVQPTISAGFFVRYQNGGEHGSYSSGDPGVVEWRIAQPTPSAPNPVSGPLPIDDPRSAQMLTDRLLLVVGVDSASNTGIACIGGGRGALSTQRRVAFPRSATVDWGTLRPESAYWNAAEARLFVFDALDRQLYQATWRGVEQALPSASAFSRVADLSASEVGHDLPARLMRSHTGQGVHVSFGGRCSWMLLSEYDVHHDGTRWVTTEHSMEPR